ncbi:hypothetical protein QVD17_32214 [Tagetes erecta]|uniref:Replication factor A C-terminal domain-containing protein n=1 Tax=Tagetes erecta TaxID=13708 RepID=A0AAD8K748_TARER|nr:hypothetical protein QVD17_32214 [Tagetes erecta]
MVLSYSSNYGCFIIKDYLSSHVLFVGELQVQTDRYATRVFKNEEINETDELRRRLLVKYAQSGASSSQIVLTSETVYPLRQEFVVDNQIKHVDEISESKEVSSCVVVATIKMVQEKYGWFYAGCRKCAKKVLTKKEFLEKFHDISDDILNLSSTALICPKCKCECESITPKFKVQVRVQDHTGSVSFVLFDNQVAKLIGVPAVDIRERQVNDKNTETFPHEMSRLLERKLAFKIEVSDYNLKNPEWMVYTVLKVCDDPEVISELLGDGDHADEVSQEYLQMNPVNLGESSQGPQDSISKDVVSVMADSSMMTSENDSATSPNGKRSVEKDDDNLNVGELSTNTKRSRKKPSKFEN